MLENTFPQAIALTFSWFFLIGFSAALELGQVNFEKTRKDD